MSQQMDVDGVAPPDPAVQDDSISSEILCMPSASIRTRTQLLDSEMRIMRSEVQRVTHNVNMQKGKIRENTERIRVG